MPLRSFKFVENGRVKRESTIFPLAAEKQGEANASNRIYERRQRPPEISAQQAIVEQAGRVHPARGRQGDTHASAIYIEACPLWVPMKVDAGLKADAGSDFSLPPPVEKPEGAQVSGI
ncbi:hypothetical protein BSKO_03184 [Bryopsis sp. KO-2023]|nr:hypothetical protein BSKO_03184 [Bryopsis sp. KO-2023]